MTPPCEEEEQHHDLTVVAMEQLLGLDQDVVRPAVTLPFVSGARRVIVPTSSSWIGIPRRVQRIVPPAID